MRQQLIKTVSEVLKKDRRVVLLLGDIGVHGFRQAFKEFPDRVYNIGILEQGTIGAAAGLAKVGLIPVFHTIAPFMVERALEQLKLDFGYQGLGGNFISVGGSYDYSFLGCTHQCPADLALLRQIPGMEIVVPGTAEEFDKLFRQSYADGRPTYFRLSEFSNKASLPVSFGKANLVKKGKKATVIAVGPLLDRVREACQDLEVNLIYYTTITLLDLKILKQNLGAKKFLVCEPGYSSGLGEEISKVFLPEAVTVETIAVPREFIRDYTSREKKDEALGLTTKNIRKHLQRLIHEN